MDGVDDLHIIAVCETGEGGTNALETRSEAFAAVGRYHDQFLPRVEFGPGQAAQRAAVQLVTNVEDGVDAGVAGDADGLRGNSFTAQVAGRGFRGSEMQRGEARGENAVHFFGKRLAQIPGAQAGFDVS